jgi:hypothetical protein
LTPAREGERLPTATGSRRRDLTLFALVALALAAGAPRLAVYHRLRVVQVEVERVHADGARERLPTPEGFRRPGSDLDWIERRIEDFMRRKAPADWRAPGRAIEWRVRWSDDSLRLDQVRTLRFREAPP